MSSLYKYCGSYSCNVKQGRVFLTAKLLYFCTFQVAKVAALLHKAADMDHKPTLKETKYLLPKPALSARDIKPPQWVNMVQSSWAEVEELSSSGAKAKVK